MDLELSEEQRILRENVAKFCRTEIPIAVVRSLADHPIGITDELWAKIAEQGLLGVMVPEKFGGLGLGTVELGIILEEMGRALVPGPYFSSAALAVPLLNASGSETLQQGWLERLATGAARGTLALLEGAAELGPAHVQCRAVGDGNGYVLTGKKFFVPDLFAADFAIAAARTGARPDDITLFLVERAAPGVSLEQNLLADCTSRSGQMILDGVRVGSDAIVGELGRGWNAAESALRVANVGIAASSLGGAEQVLHQTVAYGRERKQFGVPIGSFQAVKHPLANLFAEIESARSAYSYAAWAVDAASPEAASAVALARLTCTEAYTRMTLTSLQAHGGIGFTWEYDLHLHIKRAKHNQYLLGVPSDYEELVARHAIGI